MSGSATAGQNAWIERVLGVTPPAAGAAASRSDAFRRAWGAAQDAWLEALDTVDAQVDMLGAAMRASGDAALVHIADSGLKTLFDATRAQLTVACAEVAAASEEALPDRIAAARTAIGAFASGLGKNEKIAACDAFDLGVAVAIRATLSPALKLLADALRQAPAPVPA